MPAIVDLNESAKSGSAQSLFALSGVIGTILFTILTIFAGLLRPGYNQLSGSGLSELGAGPNGVIWNAGVILFGLLTIVFAVGLNRGIRSQGKSSKVGPLLLAISGAALVGVGVFTAERPTFLIHSIFALVQFASSFLAPLVISRRLKKDALWHRYWTYSLATGFTALVILILYLTVVTTQPPTSDADFSALAAGTQVVKQGGLAPFAGGIQRLFLAIVWIWIEVMAIHLLRLSNQPHPVKTP